MSESAFDRLAATYDEDFTTTPIAAYLRGVAHARLARLVQPAVRVLELGCGTGEDACAVARMGAHVTATDASAAMLAIAREKTRGLSVSTAHLDLNTPEASEVDGVFDGVYSNFGALNCAIDRAALAAWLARRIRAGGWAAFAVMGPLCLWEIAWHGVHGQFRTATRRWRPSTFQIDDSPPVTVTCPSPRRLTREFAPHFERVSVRPFGLFVPHTAAYAVVEKRPWLLRRLLSLDKITNEAAPLALFGDHYWITFRRRYA
jgi:SAM-dependent methyltransferase